MMELKLCQNCKWSKPEPHSEWSNRCFHPGVNAKDYHALLKWILALLGVWFLIMVVVGFTAMTYEVVRRALQ